MPLYRGSRRLILRRRSGLDPSTTAWVAAVGTAGGTVSGTQQTNVDTLIKALKAHSLFSVHDRIWLHASENSQQATIDIVNLGVAAPVNSPGFVPNQGYSGNGTTSYLDTNYNTHASAVNATQNSTSVTSYIRTNRTSSSNMAAFGFADGLSSGTISQFFPFAPPGNIILNLNTSGFPQYSNVSGTARGCWTISRTGSAVTDAYRNSGATSLGTDTSASTTMPGTNVNFFIGASNNNSAGTQWFSTDEIAITAIGAGLSGANAAQFQTDLNDYMKALPGSVNVY